MRTKYKPWAKPYIEEHKEVMLELDELKNLTIPFHLEIGSGKGGFLLGMANKFPDSYFVGIERNVTCCGFTAKKLVENKITNAKLVFNNADLLFDVIRENSVDNIFLNFSDPWPKKRHEKRRLTADRYLNFYYSILKKGGCLIIKTDNVDLFSFTKENIANSKFEVVSCTDDYKELEDFDCMTEYESSFRSEGVKINRVVLRK